MKSGHTIKLPSSGLLLVTLLLLGTSPAHALKSDRQQPLEVKADATEGTLGDGTATLKGNVEIRQGSLLIRADTARVERVEGRVRRFDLTGNPVHLQQDIEQEGLVSAEARKVEYEVASGIVTLTGSADVDHPQYHISGEVLRYDLNAQHFQGSGGESDGRIRIRMDPEVIQGQPAGQDSQAEPPTETDRPADPQDAPDKPSAESDGSG